MVTMQRLPTLVHTVVVRPTKCPATSGVSALSAWTERPHRAFRHPKSQLAGDEGHLAMCPCQDCTTRTLRYKNVGAPILLFARLRLALPIFSLVVDHQEGRHRGAAKGRHEPPVFDEPAVHVRLDSFRSRNGGPSGDERPPRDIWTSIFPHVDRFNFDHLSPKSAQ